MRLLICVVLVLSVAGCSDDGSSPPRDGFEISGTLTDADGAPVAGAAVVLDYEYAPVSPLPVDKPRTKIAFAIAEAGTVRVTISPSCDGEILHDTGDMELDAGTYDITWDATDQAGKYLPEGVFVVRLTATGQEPAEMNLVLFRNVEDDDGDFAAEADHIRADWRLDAVTDRRGRFVLDRGCWDFGYEFEGRDETGASTGTFAISHRARLWFYPEGTAQGTPGPWVGIDPEHGGVLDFTLPPAP